MSAPGIPHGMPLRFEAHLASGPGGQHVNKTSSAARLYAQIDAPGALPYPVLQRLKAALAGRISADGTLRIESSEERSLERNKARCLEKLAQWIAEARIQPKTRRATQPTRGSQERRIAGKKARSQIKGARSWRPGD